MTIPDPADLEAIRRAANKSRLAELRASLTEPCPKCQSNRVLVGPAYDRHAFRCLQCGHAWNGTPQ